MGRQAESVGAGPSAPLFSVIVPVYDAGAFLGQCLASLDAQTCRDFEAILVDDGSTDGSGVVCDAWAADRAGAAVLHQANQGQLLARRAGIARARGNYLVFLDADDCLRPDALERIGAAIDETGADIVAFGHCRGPEPAYGRSEPLGPGIEPGVLYDGDRYEAVREAVASGLFNSLATKAVRRTLVDSGDYACWTGLRHGEDLFQLIPFVDAGRSLCALGETLYFYRENPASSTAAFRPSQVDDLEVVCTRLDEHARRWGGRCPAEARAMACRHGRWLLAGVAAAPGSFAEKAASLERVRGLVARHGGDLDEALGRLRPDAAVPLRLLMAGRFRASLACTAVVDGLYRAVQRARGRQGR